MCWWWNKDVKGWVCANIDGSRGWCAGIGSGAGVGRGIDNEVEIDDGDKFGE